MKKRIVCVSLLICLLAIGCSVASPEKKALTALEAYFHCIGNGELDELNKYANGNAMRDAQLIIAFESEEEKEKYKNFKADEAQLELKDDRYLYVITFFGGANTFEIVNTDDGWKVNGLVANQSAPQLSPEWNTSPFGKITNGEGRNK